jgi:hypothetical protein
MRLTLLLTALLLYILKVRPAISLGMTPMSTHFNYQYMLITVTSRCFRVKRPHDEGTQLHFWGVYHC